MTIDYRTTGTTTSKVLRNSFRLICAATLCVAGLPALAQSAGNDVANVDSSSATGTGASASQPTVRNRADAAATATLAALLPHLAASDTIPLMDRSAMFAGDLSRLLANYDASQGAVTAAESAVTDSKAQAILKRAMAMLGTPYRWGGTSPDGGFDCSGLVGYVFKTALGIDLPRVSRDMARDGDAELIKDPNALVAGDLVFFGKRGRIDHVGIYVGEGRFLHAPSTGKDVRVDSLASGYWSNKFMQARRVLL